MSLINDIEYQDTPYLERVSILVKRELVYRKLISGDAAISPDEKLVPVDGTKYKGLKNKKVHFNANIKYLKSLLSQDWSFLFEGDSLSPEKIFYVYAHVVPKEIIPDLSRRLNIFGNPFYIGKGCGDRAYDLGRNQGHGVKLKSILNLGYQKKHIVNIIKEGLPEADALALESKLIYFFGTKYETERTKGVLYNLDVGKRPAFGVKKREKFKTIRRKGTLCLGATPKEYFND